MFNKDRSQKVFSSISLGLILTSIYGLPLNAQTNTSEYDFLEDIEAGRNIDWDFSSEDESTSIRDEINKLGEYNISETKSRDVRITEENRRWGSRGDAAVDYTIETEVYDY
ncbi:hypothetical protein [Pleurocapsa sp. PCC 7319]|uniref:hypothetical protein n=1 Tax=Pleurocapsa sp. PCC 7319 TaxID=118161 RepID=UPI00034C2DC5|nr:hypothetical protein [Pleurocapsa sp. PCC 7319]